MNRYYRLLFFWLLADGLLFIAAYMCAYILRVGPINSTDYPFTQHLLATVLAMPLFVGSLITTRTFALTRNQWTVKNTAYIAYSALLGLAAFSLCYYFLYKDLFSRLLLMQAYAISTAYVFAWHIVFSNAMRRMLRNGKPAFPTLIIGVTRESKELVRQLIANNNPLTPVAILDGRGTKETEVAGVPVKGKLNSLEKVLKEDGITHVIQCSDLEQSLNLLSACRQFGITYALLPSVLGIVERDERIETLEGHAVSMVSPQMQKWTWFFR